MTSSTKAYNDYVKDILAPQMDPKALAEIREIEKNKDFTNPKFQELLWKEFYTKYIIRIPIPGFTSQWHSNSIIYNLMQGPSEFGVTGTLLNWNRENDLKKIYAPTLTIGATYDEMNPEHMKWMATQVKNGRFLLCPNGSHYAMYDDQKVYFEGLIKFIKDVAQGLVENK
jgi:proline iminopeptidase